MAFLAALVMAEVGWLIAYESVREVQPYITLGPSLGFLVTILVFALTLRRRRGGAAPGC